MIRIRRALALGLLLALVPLVGMAQVAGAKQTVHGDLRNVTAEQLATGGISVSAINPNLAKVVKTVHPTAPRYEMDLPTGLYLMGIDGVDVRDARRYSHAFRLQQDQRRRVDLPRVKVQSSAAPTSHAPLGRSAGSQTNVVTVDNVPANGIPGVREGADLSGFVLTDLFRGARRRCPNDVTFTSNEAREAAQREIDYQQAHPEFFDKSTTVKPNFVTPTSRVSGSMSYSDGQVTISLTQTDLETGETRRSDSITGPAESLFDLMTEIGERFGEKLCPYPERWSGSTSGSATFAGSDYLEMWSGNYVLKHEGDGFYMVESGTFEWEFSNSYPDPGGGTCHASAQASIPAGGNLFLLTTNPPEYSHGLAFAGAGMQEVTEECPRSTTTSYMWPVNGGVDSDALPWTIGADSLSGDRTYNPSYEPDATLMFSWNLTAQE